MPDESKVTQMVTMSYKIDGSGIGRYRAEVALSIAGAVEVSEQRFDCADLTNVSEAQLLAVYARWALARQICQAVTGHHPVDTTVVGDDNGWSTRVVWRTQGLPTVTVTVPGFNDFPHAAATARTTVTDLAKTIVPAPTDPLRSHLVVLPEIPEWFDVVRAKHVVFP